VRRIRSLRRAGDTLDAGALIFTFPDSAKIRTSPHEMRLRALNSHIEGYLRERQSSEQIRGTYTLRLSLAIDCLDLAGELER
jgi:hypothetical protein